MNAISAKPRPHTDVGTIAQFTLSALAAVGCFNLALLFAFTGLLQLVSEPGTPVATTSLIWAAGIALFGALLMPSAWYALERILRRSFPRLPTVPEQRRFFVLTILMLTVLPVSMWIGSMAAGDGNLSWLVLPPLTLIVIGLPIWWLVSLGSYRLPKSSAQRSWGVVASGLILGPALILTIEILLLALFGLGGLVFIARDPDLLREITLLMQRLQFAPPNEEMLVRILSPYLLRPGVVIAAFTFAAILVPLLEEALKPVGVWLLMGRKITPAEGFVAGAICGAGFALFESLGNISAGGEMWVAVGLTRIGTALLHIFNSALVGWALAEAWTNRRYLFFGAVYLLAVVIHSLWNGLALLAVVGYDLPASLSIPENLKQFGVWAGIGLALLGVLVFISYLALSRRLRWAIIRYTSSQPEFPKPASPEMVEVETN